MIDPTLLQTQSTVQNGIALLSYLALSSNSPVGSFVLSNTLNQAKLEYSASNEPDVDDLLGLLADSWAWLESQALIGPDHKQSHTSGWCRVTAAGAEVIRRGSATRVVAENQLAMQMHSTLEGTVRANFTAGDYETATFAAMKAVEVRVRDLSKADASVLGVQLMIHAFKPDHGALADATMQNGEQLALMNLFQGAIGVFKNPASHRPVDYDDPTEAAEVVLFADLLMRLLDRYEGSGAHLGDI